MKKDRNFGFVKTRGVYQRSWKISNYGRVLRPDNYVIEFDHTELYPRVSIGGCYYLLSNLMAAIVHGPPASYDIEVLHINETKGYKHRHWMNNIRWGTHSCNVKDSFDNNKDRKQGHLKKRKRIFMYDHQHPQNPILRSSFETVVDASKQTGIPPSTIYRCLKTRKITKSIAFSTLDTPILTGEVWKQMVIGPGKYELDIDEDILQRNKNKLMNLKISNMGRYSDINGCILTPSPRDDGYCYIQILRKNVYVHHLVIRAFTGPPPGENYTVEHKDFSRDNNCSTNLEYITQGEQIRRCHSKPGRKKKRCKCVCVLNLTTAEEKILTVEQVHVLLGLNHDYIRNLSKRNDTWKNYKFRYYREPDREGEKWFDVKYVDDLPTDHFIRKQLASPARHALGLAPKSEPQ